jgi:hypothetical protein
MRFLCVICFCLVGCNPVPYSSRPATAAASASDAGVTVEQGGAAATPAAGNVDRSETALDLPAGSLLFRDSGGAVAVELPRESGGRLSISSLRAAVIGPASFSPPAPPSPTELAAGKLTIGGAVVAAVGVTAVLTGWPQAGLLALAAGGCLIAAAKLAQVPAWLFWVAFGLIGTSVGIWWGYSYLEKQRAISPTPTPL